MLLLKLINYLKMWMSNLIIIKYNNYNKSKWTLILIVNKTHQEC
jgi:hypothetical protein